MFARVYATILATQPLSVEEMGAGELRTQRRTGKASDRFLVRVLGRISGADESSAATLDAGGPVRTGEGLEGELPQCIVAERRLARSDGGFDQLREREVSKDR